MLNQIELDKKETERTKVRVQIIYPDVKSYKANAETLKAAAEKGGGSLAVKMV